MPWKVNDVDRHKKHLSKSEKRKWVDIANYFLKKLGDDVSAIKIANSKTKILSQKKSGE